MRYMFTMMNNARLSVGLEGLSLAERAFQMALAYAKERRQGRAPGAPAGEQSLIIEHPDVRRMLLTQKACIEALRGIIYANAAAMDRAARHPDEAVRAGCDELADILTPVSKGWGTDLGVELTSLALQVFGGMGYIEETGVAQHYRDARIAPIYEGTNGIQAMDLVGRKLPMRAGGAIGDYLGQIQATVDALATAGDDLASIHAALADGLDAVRAATDWLLANGLTDPLDALAGATPYLRLFSLVTGGWVMALQAQAASRLLADAGAGGQGPLRGQGAHRPVLLRAGPAASPRPAARRHRHQPRPGRRRPLSGAMAERSLWLGEASWSGAHLTITYGVDAHQFSTSLWWEGLDLDALAVVDRARRAPADGVPRRGVRGDEGRQPATRHLRPRPLRRSRHGAVPCAVVHGAPPRLGPVAVRARPRRLRGPDDRRSAGGAGPPRSHSTPPARTCCCSAAAARTAWWRLACSRRRGCPTPATRTRTPPTGRREPQHALIDGLLDHLHPTERLRHWVYDDLLDVPVERLAPELGVRSVTAAETPASLFGALPSPWRAGCTDARPRPRAQRRRRQPRVGAHR